MYGDALCQKRSVRAFYSVGAAHGVTSFTSYSTKSWGADLKHRNLPVTTNAIGNMDCIRPQYWIKRACHPRVFLTPSLISRKTAGAREIARWERTWVGCSEPHKNSDEIACICNPSTPKMRQTAEAEQLPISSWASHPDAWHSSRGKRLLLFQGGEWERAHYRTPTAAQSRAINK